MQLVIDKLGKVAVTVEESYWNIDKDYDKLTIVEKEGIFGTYISRKPVPAGTELTNRTYWIPFSSVKESIVLDYNKFLDTCKKVLDSHAEELEEHETRLNTVENNFKNHIDDTIVKFAQLDKSILDATTERGAISSKLSVVEDTAKKNKAAIDVLNGTGEGSISDQIADAIAEVIAGAPEDLDTLKELADWIKTHGAEAATMNSKIKANEISIANIETNIDTIEQNVSDNANDIINIKAENRETKADIAKLKKDVSDNTTSIAANADKIAVLEPKVATNTSDINTNAGKIAKNELDIETNTRHIIALENNTINGHKISSNPVIDGSEIAVGNITEASSTEFDNLDITKDTKINEAISSLQNKIKESTNIRSTNEFEVEADKKYKIASISSDVNTTFVLIITATLNGSTNSYIINYNVNADSTNLKVYNSYISSGDIEDLILSIVFDGYDLNIKFSKAVKFTATFINFEHDILKVPSVIEDTSAYAEFTYIVDFYPNKINFEDKEITADSIKTNEIRANKFIKNKGTKNDILLANGDIDSSITHPINNVNPSVFDLINANSFYTNASIIKYLVNSSVALLPNATKFVAVANRTFSNIGYIAYTKYANPNSIYNTHYKIYNGTTKNYIEFNIKIIIDENKKVKANIDITNITDKPIFKNIYIAGNTDNNIMYIVGVLNDREQHNNLTWRITTKEYSQNQFSNNQMDKFGTTAEIPTEYFAKLDLTDEDKYKDILQIPKHFSDISVDKASIKQLSIENGTSDNLIAGDGSLIPIKNIEPKVERYTISETSARQQRFYFDYSNINKNKKFNFEITCGTQKDLVFVFDLYIIYNSTNNTYTLKPIILENDQNGKYTNNGIYEYNIDLGYTSDKKFIISVYTMQNGGTNFACDCIINSDIELTKTDTNFNTRLIGTNSLKSERFRKIITDEIITPSIKQSSSTITNPGYYKSDGTIEVLDKIDGYEYFYNYTFEDNSYVYQKHYEYDYSNIKKDKNIHLILRSENNNFILDVTVEITYTQENDYNFSVIENNRSIADKYFKSNFIITHSNNKLIIYCTANANCIFKIHSSVPLIFSDTHVTSYNDKYFSSQDFINYFKKTINTSDVTFIKLSNYKINHDSISDTIHVILTLKNGISKTISKTRIERLAFNIEFHGNMGENTNSDNIKVRLVDLKYTNYNNSTPQASIKFYYMYDKMNVPPTASIYIKFENLDDYEYDIITNGFYVGYVGNLTLTTLLHTINLPSYSNIPNGTIIDLNYPLLSNNLIITNPSNPTQNPNIIDTSFFTEYNALKTKVDSIDTSGETGISNIISGSITLPAIQEGETNAAIKTQYFKLCEPIIVDYFDSSEIDNGVSIEFDLHYKSNIESTNIDSVLSYKIYENNVYVSGQYNGIYIAFSIFTFKKYIDNTNNKHYYYILLNNPGIENANISYTIIDKNNKITFISNDLTDSDIAKLNNSTTLDATFDNPDNNSLEDYEDKVYVDSVPRWFTNLRIGHSKDKFVKTNGKFADVTDYYKFYSRISGTKCLKITLPTNLNTLSDAKVINMSLYGLINNIPLNPASTEGHIITKLSFTIYLEPNSSGTVNTRFVIDDLQYKGYSNIGYIKVKKDNNFISIFFTEIKSICYDILSSYDNFAFTSDVDDTFIEENYIFYRKLINNSSYKNIKDLDNINIEEISFINRINNTSVIVDKSTIDQYNNAVTKLSSMPNMVILTQAEYNALTTKDENTLYFIK